MNLHVQSSWQAQHFVNLQVQISWQAQYKMRFREIADARNAVFFDRTGGQALRNDVRETVSGHARIMVGIVPPLWLEFSFCLLYTSPSPRDGLLSRMPSSA